MEIREAEYLLSLVSKDTGRVFKIVEENELFVIYENGEPGEPFEYCEHLVGQLVFDLIKRNLIDISQLTYKLIYYPKEINGFCWSLTSKDSNGNEGPETAYESLKEVLDYIYEFNIQIKECTV